ncbi:MAG TPA: hypothetical protein PLW65_19375, partial [Pseudomonadota bacterium]|nr:hypothetical protein [Pseudomonadota bacterium]
SPPSATATAPGERGEAAAQPLPATAPVSAPEPPAEDLRSCEPSAAAAQSADLVATAAPVSPSAAPPDAQTPLPGETAPAAAEPRDAQTLLPGELAPAAAEPPDAQTLLPGGPAPTTPEPPDAQRLLPGGPAPTTPEPPDAQTLLPGGPAPTTPEPPDAQTFLPGEPAPAAPAPPNAAQSPDALPTGTARPAAAPLPPGRSSVDGSWLQAERERAGLSRNSLRQLLNIQWATYAKIERQKLPVPRRFWPKLKEVGFRFPGKPAPASAPPVAPPPPAVPKLQVGLRGTWLRRQRQRLGLSDRDLWKALRVHWRTLTVVEQHNRVIPAAWLPALERLGMTAPSGPEAASAPRPRSAPAVSPPAAAPPAAAAAPSAVAAAPAQPEGPGEDVLSMIVKYRLALGRRSRQSAVEIMALIAHDLRTADLSQAITHDQLAAAMQSLLRSRSAA